MPTFSRNPFEHLSGEVTSLVGMAVAIAAAGTSQLGVRYDGAFDLHAGFEPIAPVVTAFDQAIAFPLAALAFWALAKPFARRTRFADHLGTIGCARIPTVLAAVPIGLLSPSMALSSSAPVAETAANQAATFGGSLMLAAVLGLAAVAAQLWLLVLGFRAATGLRGGALAGALVLAMVGAEAASKLALWIGSHWI